MWGQMKGGGGGRGGQARAERKGGDVEQPEHRGKPAVTLPERGQTN